MIDFPTTELPSYHMEAAVANCNLNSQSGCYSPPVTRKFVCTHPPPSAHNKLRINVATTHSGSVRDKHRVIKVEIRASGSEITAMLSEKKKTQ